MKQRRLATMKQRRRTLALTISVAVLFQGCGSPAHHAKVSHATSTTTTTVPGISAHEILVGTHQPITGSDSPGLDEVAPATAAFFDYINAHGGIFGRSIAYKVDDDASDPTQAGNVVRQLVLHDGVFAILNGIGTDTHGAVEAFLNAEHVPDLFAGSGCTCWNDMNFPFTSGWQPDYVIEGKILGQYLSQREKQDPALAKVAYVYENDALGQQGVRGLDQEVDPSSVVTRQAYQAPTATLAQAQAVVAALQASGAQAVAVMADPSLTALTLLAAADASYHPLWLVGSEGADPDTLTALLRTYGAGDLGTYGPGASPAVIETGIVSDAYLPLPSDVTSPWINLFSRIHDEYAPSLPFDSFVVYGMSVAYTFYALMEAAGPDPTRSSVMQALQSANLNGPNLAPYGYGSGSRQGMTGARIAVDNGGTLQDVSPVYVTSDDGPISVYSSPQPTVPPKF